MVCRGSYFTIIYIYIYCLLYAFAAAYTFPLLLSRLYLFFSFSVAHFYNPSLHMTQVLYHTSPSTFLYMRTWKLTGWDPMSGQQQHRVFSLEPSPEVLPWLWPTRSSWFAEEWYMCTLFISPSCLGVSCALCRPFFSSLIVKTKSPLTFSLFFLFNALSQMVQGMNGSPILYKSTSDAFRQIYKAEGLLGFYKGITPNYFKVSIMYHESYPLFFLG